VVGAGSSLDGVGSSLDGVGSSLDGVGSDVEGLGSSLDGVGSTGEGGGALSVGDSSVGDPSDGDSDGDSSEGAGVVPPGEMVRPDSFGEARRVGTLPIVVVAHCVATGKLAAAVVTPVVGAAAARAA
jgi:hypothetical protein